MFNGGMAILQEGSYDEQAPRNALFQIRLNRANQVKAFEVECQASSLNSNDTFLLVKEGESDYGFAEERLVLYDLKFEKGILNLVNFYMRYHIIQLN